MADTKLRRPTDEEKAAIVADHKAGMTFVAVAEKWGLATSTVHRYVDATRRRGKPKAETSRRERDDVLAGRGRWVPRGGIQVWEVWS